MFSKTIIINQYAKKQTTLEECFLREELKMDNYFS